MPGASYVRAAADGGQMKGGAPRVVWLTLGADPQLISAHAAAERLDQIGRPCHIVWNPLTGHTVQLIPIVRAGLALGVADGLDRGAAAGALADGAAGVHTEGRLCVQVGVVGLGGQAFTSGPLAGVGLIMEWLDSWAIPRRWPAGPPAPFARARAVPRSRRLWARGGHFGGSQVPCCLAAGPGAIDVEKLTGPPAPRAAEVPRPRPAELARMGGMLAEDEPDDALVRVG